jgi:uncharacterized protein YecE (DUF72 family)
MILVGTSGWQYRDWRRRFYPEGLAQREWLGYFSERFPVVEINNTFYMLPKDETFVRWREESARDFLFVVKASRFITHIRRLRDCRDPLKLFWSRCRRLGKKLGPVLFQLPPNFPADLERLDGFLGLLPPSMRAALEFRHPSWDTDETRELLDRAGCALVLADRPGWRVPDVMTGGWAYVRFHQEEARPLRRPDRRLGGARDVRVLQQRSGRRGGARRRHPHGPPSGSEGYRGRPPDLGADPNPLTGPIRRGRRGHVRQIHPERRPPAGAILDPRPPPVQLGEPRHQRQPDTGAR